MSGPVYALILTTVIHIIGMVVLISMCGREIIDMFRSKPMGDGGDGGEPPTPEPSAAPRPGGGGLPLPDAEQTSVRLREPGRISDRYARPSRRPEHQPAPVPQRERV